MQPKITLVELAATEFGRLDTNITRDVYYRFNNPPRALPLLHAILLEQGYDDVRSLYTKYRRRGQLSQKDWKRIRDSDFLLLSSITRTQPQTMELARTYKQMNPQGTVVIGGPHVTYLDQETLDNDFVDVVVRGEGDRTLPELMERLVGKEYLDNVLGITFKKENQILRNPDGPSLTEEEFSALPLPYIDKTASTALMIPTIITSRGCPFDCDFCLVTQIYGPQYRMKSIDSIMSDIDSQRRKYLFVGDDNFAGKPKQTEALLDRLIDDGIRHNYGVQIDAHSAVRGGLAEKMKRTGINYAFIGIESVHQESLDSVNKKVTPKLNEEAVKTLREAGIWVHGMFIIGLKGDDMQYLDHLTEWAKQNVDSAQFFSIVPIPGTRLAARMEKDGSILTHDYYLYDGQHVLTMPEKIEPYALQNKLLDMHLDFYSNKNFKDTVRPTVKRVLNAYGRRIIRNMRNSDQMKAHLDFLRKI